ncbi:MAG: TIGR01777 family oxidoreductase [Cytophagaceae bacterium]|nr:TIGR01777 family oxidoreductase [Cytophagaceae bacterium]
MEKVLVTGGTGLVGSSLIPFLKSKGYEPYVLSRKPSKSATTLYWNPSRKHIDLSALQKMDYIIHLAGSNVFEKKWSEENKKEILESRVEGARLLSMAMKEHGIKPKAFITASGVAYYGTDTGDQWINEEAPKGPGFLSEVVEAWEKEADTIAAQGVRTVKFRIGLVLSSEGGALEKMKTPALMGASSPLGSGDQYMPWIDVLDLCAMMEFGLKNPVQGVFNAVAPNPVTNKEFTKLLARTLRRPAFLPAVPAFVLNLMFGKEKAALLLGGNRISPQKIQQQGFQFEYPELSASMARLLKK